MKTKSVTLIAVVFVVALAACATQYAPDRLSEPYGFFSGILHGMLFPIAVTAKLISWFVSFAGFSLWDKVTLTGKPNTGFTYYWGFFLGLALLGGGGSAAR